MNHDMNLPEPLAEVRLAFARYEEALTTNDLDVLDELFLKSDCTVRYGVFENLAGYVAIQAYRRGRPAGDLARELRNTVITTFGRDFATASTEFTRDGEPRIGRQSHAWLRTPEGWRIVAAHVSLMG